MLLLLLAEEPLHQTPEFLANKSTSWQKEHINCSIKNSLQMRRHILAYTFLLLVLASADALEFYGYLTFEDQNIGLSASGSTTPGKEDLGCVDPNKLFPRNTSDFYFQLALYDFIFFFRFSISSCLAFDSASNLDCRATNMLLVSSSCFERN